MSVTLACQDHLPAGTTLVERLTNLKSYGFDAVELLGRGLLDRLAETRAALAQTGVPVAAICAGFEGSLLHPEPSQRRLALDGIKRLLDVAEELGAGGVIAPADYGTPPLPDPEPWERAKAVKIAAAQAARLDVAMAENASTHLSL